MNSVIHNYCSCWLQYIIFASIFQANPVRVKLEKCNSDGILIFHEWNVIQKIVQILFLGVVLNSLLDTVSCIL